MAFRIFGAMAAITYAALATAIHADPLTKPVIGPQLICFKYSTFALGAAERITGVSGAPEGISIDVEGPSGKYEVAESEIFAPPRGPKRLVYSHGQTRVYRVAGTKIRYAAYGPTSFSDGEDRLVIWLSGDALSGAKKDRDIFTKFEVRDTSDVKCLHTFTYSWDFQSD